MHREVKDSAARSHCSGWLYDHSWICLSMHHYAASNENISMILNPSTAVCSCDQSGHSGEEVLCTSGKAEHLNQRSSSLIPLTVNDSIKRPDRIQTGPSPSLSAVVKWALGCACSRRRGFMGSDGTQQQACPQKQMVRNTPHFLVFFSIIEISYT